MKEGFEKQPISSQTPNWLLIVATVLVTGLIAGGGVFVWQNSKLLKVKKENQEKIQNLNQQIQSLNQEIERLGELVETNEEKSEIPEDWKTYRNKEYGFEVKYLPGLEISENPRSVEKPSLQLIAIYIPCYTPLQDIPEEDLSYRLQSPSLIKEIEGEEMFEAGVYSIEIEIAENSSQLPIKDWLEIYLKPKYEEAFMAGEWNQIKLEDFSFAGIKGIKAEFVPAIGMAGGCSPKIYVSKESKVYSIGNCLYEAPLYECSLYPEPDQILSTFKFID